MRNAKLWSVLLASVLLCACVLGVLFVGANAETKTVTFTVETGAEQVTEGVDGTNTFPTLTAAIAYLKANPTMFEGDSYALTIQLENSITGDDAKGGSAATGGEILWGLPTLFTGDNKKMDITVKGGMDISLAWVGNTTAVNCANDITFDTLTLPWAGATRNFNAGIGEVRFVNTDITGGSGLVLSADMPSTAVDATDYIFEGWTEDRQKANMTAVEGETEPTYLTSMTLGTGTTYACTDNYNLVVRSYAAVTFDAGTIKTANTKMKVAMENGSVYGGRVIVANTPAGTKDSACDEMIIDIQTGAKLFCIYGVYSTSGTKAAEIWGDVSLNFCGTATGGGYAIRGVQGSSTNAAYFPILHGDLNYYIGGATMKGGTGSENHIQGAFRGKIDGDFTMVLENQTSNNPVIALAGASICTGDVNVTIKGSSKLTNATSYQLANGTATTVGGTVTNTIQAGAEITAFRGVASGKVTGTVTNNVEGGTITNFYGVYSGTVPSVSNTVSGGTITNFYGTNSVTIGDVSNTFEGDCVVKQEVYGAYKGTTGNVTNTFKGGTFCSDTTSSKTYYFRSTYGSTAKDVVNNYQGGTFKGEVRGPNEGTIDTVTNHVSGTATFNKAFHGIYNITNVKGKTGVEYPIKNVISGGTFNSTFAGSFFRDKAGWPVKNEISGGHFGGTCHLLTYGGKDVPAGFNEIGGSAVFKGTHVYLIGGSVTWPTVSQGATTTITGGSFFSNVYGIAESCYVTGDVVTRVEGGTFSAKDKNDQYDVAFYGGGVGALNQQHRLLSSRKTYIPFEDYGKSLAEGAKLINIFGKEGSTEGPTMNCNVYGGNKIGTTTDTYNKDGELTASGHNRTKEFGSIENTVYGGTFAGFYGGHAGNAFNGNGTKFVVTTEGDTTTYEDVEDTSPLPVTDITNTIKGGTFNGLFFGASSAGTEGGVIINNVSGGKFVKSYYGGSASEGVCGSITNNVTGGEFVTGKSGSFVGGGASQSTSGDVKNTISNGIFHTDAYGAGVSGSNSGAVTNEISGTALFKGKFFGASSFEATTASVKNTVTGGTFEELFCGGCNNGSTITGDVINDVSGCTFKAGYMGAFSASDLDTRVGGNVQNTFGDCVFTSTDGNNDYVICGGDDSDTKSGTVAIGGTITNVFNEGFETKKIYVYGGSDCATNTEAIFNTINGGTFHGFWGVGGTEAAIHDGTVTNVVNGGTFGIYSSTLNNSFIAGARNGKVNGNVTTTINGGTFTGLVANVGPGGDKYLKAQGDYDFTMTIYGGTFRERVLKDSRFGTMEGDLATYVLNVVQTEGKELAFLGTTVEISTLTVNGDEIEIGKNTAIVADDVTGGNLKFLQTEGWLARDYFTGPVDTSDYALSATKAETAFGEHEVVLPGGNILRGVGMTGLSSSLVLGERVGMKVYLPKADVDVYGEDFTISYTIGDKTVTKKADELAYDEEKASYVFEIEGVGLTQFETLVTVSGSAIDSVTVSVAERATAAKEVWDDQWDKLADAILNLNAVVNSENGTHDEMTYPFETPTGTATGSATAEMQALFASSKASLVMGDAVALRFRLTLAEGATAPEALTVAINGNVVENAIVFDEENGVYTIDLYFAARYMKTPFTVTLYNEGGEAADTMYLTYGASVELLAHKLATDTTNPNAENAQALLYYIQQAVACAGL